MSTNDDAKLYELLRELANTTKKIIDDGLASGSLKPDVEVYFRWKLKDFKYDDNGPSDASAQGEQFLKEDWFRASIKISEEAKNSSIYKTCLEYLKSRFGDRMSDQYLDSFVSKVIFDCLYNKRFDEHAIISLAERLLKGLKGEPLKYGAKVELQGVVLRPDKVDIAHGIIVRKTAKEDLEKEHPYYSIAMGPLSSLHPMPSSILEIEFLGTRGNEIQKKVEEATALLRLFKVGSVKHSSYHMRTESLVDIGAGGTMWSHDITTALEKYLITEDDIKPLKKFWENLQSILPESIFWSSQGKEDHVTIAYKRYSEALIQNGIIERRIANAIMGLEALLLKPGETQELVYRLSNRVAKCLGIFNFNTLEIKKIVSDAYRVRNLFAHGGQLSYKEKKKIEEKYKDVRNLLKYVLDYLRICIVAFITLNVVKDEFIDLIDASFLDRKSEEQLTGALNTAKYILVVN